MKRTISAAAIVAVACLTACAPSPAPVPSGPTSTELATASQTAQSEPTAAAAGSVKEACETFNELYAEYKALPGTEPNAYEDIYLKAQDAKDTVAGDLRGLFAALSALAIDHSAAAENGGQPEQVSKDGVRDAVFANAGNCTAEGVTLRL